jgi:hypothetical protein
MYVADLTAGSWTGDYSGTIAVHCKLVGKAPTVPRNKRGATYQLRRATVKRNILQLSENIPAETNRWDY